MESKHPYVDERYGILMNLVGATTQKELDRKEVILSTMRIEELIDDPIPGNFDQEHLQAIHYYLFQDIYPFAGEIRTEYIEKPGDPFYPSPNNPHPDGNLQLRMNKAFEDLKADDYLVRLKENAFLHRLSHHIAEIWECHPFWEGNTRTTAVFTRDLVQNSGNILSHTFPNESEAFRESLKSAAKSLRRDDLHEIFSASITMTPNSTPATTANLAVMEEEIQAVQEHENEIFGSESEEDESEL